MKPVDQTYKNDKMVALKKAIKNEIRSILSEKKRPDYPDVDKDGDREESMEKALKDKDLKESPDTSDIDKRIQKDPKFLKKVQDATAAAEKGDSSALALLMIGEIDEAYGDEKVDNDGFPAGVSDKDKEKIKGLKKEEDEDDAPDDDVIAKKAAKKAKKKSLGVKGIENEIAKKKDEKKSLKAKVDPLIAKFKAKELDKEAYMKKVGDIPKRIKALNDEIAKLEKSLDAALVKETDDMREVAATAMGRDVNRRLLEIIKESGASLHEGAAGVKMHYDIARKAYMEGLTAGLNKD